MELQRTAEVFASDNSFTSKQFGELRKGDKFRLRDPDGNLAHKGSILIAESDAFLEEGILRVNCNPLEKE